MKTPKKGNKNILPDGKTILPAQLVINKMGSSIILHVEINLQMLFNILNSNKENTEIDL
jgi:hypothetical protein